MARRSSSPELRAQGLERSAVDTALNPVAGLTSAFREAGTIVTVGSVVRPGGGMSGRSVSTEAPGAVLLRRRVGVGGGGVAVVFMWRALHPGQPKLRRAP